MPKDNFLSKFISLSLILVFFIIPAITAAISQPLNKNKTTPTVENENIDTAKISLPFIKNQGQYDLPENVLYYTQTHAGSTFLTKEGLTYSILSSNSTDDEPKFFGVKESFILDSEREIIPQALSKSDTNVSYFIGGDEDKWQRNVPAYNEVIFPNVWESIDLNVKAYSSNVEKVFTVNPSANVSNIAMILDGVNSISIGDEQELILHREGDDLLMTKPIAFQFIDGRKENVEVAYNILSDTSYGFNVGEYNTSYPLIIDPVTQSTYVGGAGTESFGIIARDSTGNIFVAGVTNSTDLPSTTGGYQEDSAGGNDFFVAKLNSDLTSITQATYVGSTASDQFLTSIKVDSSDNVILWGVTRATSGFPGINGSSGDSTYGGSSRDGVLVKLTNDLTTLTQSTYVGGSADELPTDMEIHPDTGDIYVTMECDGGESYMTGGAQASSAGGFEACLVSVSGDLTQIIQGTFRGSSGYDHGSAIAFDSNGDVFLLQVVGAGDVSNTAGGAQDTFGGTYDLLVTKFNKELTTIYQSTYFGGTGTEFPTYQNLSDHIYIDSLDNVYIATAAGSTGSSGLATAGAYQTTKGTVIIAKLSDDLTEIDSATYLGSSSTVPNIVSLGSYDDAFLYVYLTSSQSSFSQTSCGIQESNGGGTDVVLAKLSNDLTHLYQATFLGGSGTETPSYMLFNDPYIYVGGKTTSTNFPGVSGGAQDTYGGSTDAFVSKMSIYLDTGCALTPPVITSVESAPSLTSAIITWTTDKVSSSKAKYGVTTNYGNNTDEADFTNFSGVTSHSMTLTNLESCTTFHFKVSSRGYESDFASSSDYTFTTGGCASPGGGGGGGGLGGGSTYVGETVVWTSPLLPPTTPEPQPQPEPETPVQPEEPTVTEPEPEPVVVEEPIIKEEEPEPVVVEETIIKEEEPETIPTEEPENPTVEEPVTNTETPQQPVVTTPVATESFFDVVKEQAKDTFNGAKEVLLDTREEVKKVLETKEGNIASKTVTTLGVVGGASFALATTLFATPLSFSEVVLIPFRLWSLILGAFGLKRKTRRWGVVYDSITKQPLDPAYVTLKNLEGKEVASTLTDLDGRYGFLVPPGTYALMASKTNYLFPSSKLAGKAEDELYNNIYWGDYFTLAEGGVITKNIPLDPEKFDWNEFEKNKKNMMRSFKRRFVFFARLSNILFSFGFIVALIALLVVPRPYNVMIFVLYVLILLLKKIGIKTKNQGSVTEKETGLPLSFGIIRVWRPDMSQEIAHTVIDQTGHFYCLVQNGTYKITIEKKNQDDGYTTIFTSEPLDVKKGVVNVDFEV